MKKLIFLGILALLLSSCAKAQIEETESYETVVYEAPIIEAPYKDIVIFATSDVNAHYTENLDYKDVKNYISKLSDDYNFKTLVDVGNFSTGNSDAKDSNGKYSIEKIKELNYDIIVPGTEEFAYGYENFLDNMSELKGKVVSCNIVDTKLEKQLFPSYKIIDYDGFKIAYIGVTSPDTIMKYDLPDLYFYEDDGGAALISQVQNAILEAKENGADKVILLSHLGNSEYDEAWSVTTMVKNTVGIDAVIDGHSGILMEQGLMTNRLGAMIPMVSAGKNLEYVGAMNFTKEGYCFPAILSKNSIK